RSPAAAHEQRADAGGDGDESAGACGLGHGGYRRRRIRAGGKRRTLNADIEIDDAVIVDVDLPVIIKVAVAPSGDSQRHGEVDAPVVVDVYLAVEIRVPAVRVHDQRVASRHRLAGPDGRCGGGDAFRLSGGGDADAGEAPRRGAALRGDDAAA